MVTANPSIQSIPFHSFLLFLAIIAAIKNDILVIQPSDQSPSAIPDILPQSVQFFLSHACGLPMDTIVDSWSTFRHLAWHDDLITSLLNVPLSAFHQHGVSHGFTARTLYPPSQYCLTLSCPRTLKGMCMMHAQQWQADGPLPVYSVHLSCEGMYESLSAYTRIDDLLACEINYHHNFKVFKGERTYYGGIPDIVQISEHQFVECQVIEMWLALMDHWTSATACANFYNTLMAKSNKPPPGWAFGFSLSTEHVWSVFLLYCLLEDAMEQQEYLVVTHSGDQKDCFSELVQAQNQHMCIEGQSELTHFCDKCTHWFYGPDGRVHHKCLVVVTDSERGQSCFQLRDCLQRARDAHPTSQSKNTCVLSQLTVVDNEEVFAIDPDGHVTDADPPTSTPPAPTHKKLQAKLTRS
ncbi:hypothetical protein JVU11DRAFT_3752 [Chiua virens]|nr:hypothetical protein JVU11DRAFT_3752 [Chiua virens]